MTKNTKPIKKNQERLIKKSVELNLTDEDNISYMVKLFGFPYKKTNEIISEYFEGDLKYTLMSSKGLPYGTAPRIILSWLISEAKLKNSPKITLGYNLRGFLKEIGVDTNGRNYRKTRQQLQALLDTSYEITKENEDERHALKFFISEKDSLWWSQEAKQDNLFNSEINLSEPFFKFCKKAYPISRVAMRSLKDSPLALDLYFWIAHRISYLKRPTVINWNYLKKQFGYNYKDNANGRKIFKRYFKDALSKIKILYPALNAEIVKDGLEIRPSRTFIRKIK